MSLLLLHFDDKTKTKSGNTIGEDEYISNRAMQLELRAHKSKEVQIKGIEDRFIVGENYSLRMAYSGVLSVGTLFRMLIECYTWI